MSIMQTIKQNIFGPRIVKEALIAYFNRLPEGIEVEWFRDSNFIVGKIKADGRQYLTQGANAEDFIDMVNDAVVTMCHIPQDYKEVIRKVHSYFPPQEEWQKLQSICI